MAEAQTPEKPTIDFDLEVEDGGIARLTLRPRRASITPLRLEDLLALEAPIGDIERHAAAGSAMVVVVRTDPVRLPLGGYDLDELREISASAIRAWSREGQRILRRLEQLPIPSVAVVGGEWIGGAAELALACSFRVGPLETAALGFPQTRLGFLPAWGGTVRLPRLVGLREALRMILSGESVESHAAVSLGLVDELFPADDLEARLEGYARKRSASGRPPRRRRPLKSRLLDETAPGRRLVTSGASRKFLPDRRPNAASDVALELVRETIHLPLDDAFAREADAAAGLIAGGEARGRMHSQRLEQKTERRAPLGVPNLLSVAVVGGGDTGVEIAHLLVSAGFPVRIKDTGRARAREAVERVRDRVLWEREHGQISDRRARRRSVRVEGVSGYGGFGTVDLVLVAADDLDGPPEEVIQQIEEHLRPGCLIAFHDWSRSVGHIQRLLRFPERMIGIRLTPPTSRYPLLEVVPGMLTSPDSVATVRRLARKLGLEPVLVADTGISPGTRLLGTFIGEAVALLATGVDPEAIDEACVAFGFDLGPLQRIDAIGAGRAVTIVRQLSERLALPSAATSILDDLAGGERSFYEYRGGRPMKISWELPGGLEVGTAMADVAPLHQILLALINEGARIVEEGAIPDPGDLDLLSILGLGFPRDRGGVLYHAQETGLGEVVAGLSNLSDRVGERFAPAGLLRDLATAGRGFFRRVPDRLDTPAEP